MTSLTTEEILKAYALGFFPMADSATASEVYWYDPERRGQLPILDLKIPRSLRRAVLRPSFDVRIDTAFEAVIESCAAVTPVRPGTWINQTIRDLFVALHDQGRAHSVECWQGGTLVGGLYGLALGGVFCGESMFSRATDASKVALVHLCARLWAGGFTVLDTQFVNDHLRQFGVYEVSRAAYQEQLAAALKLPGDFTLQGSPYKDENSLVRAYFEAKDEI